MLTNRIAVVLLLAAPWLAAQSGPQFPAVFSPVDQSRQPYAVYLPKGFDPTRKYPLILSLHSEDSDHRLNLAQILGPANRTAMANRVNADGPALRDVDFIVACPFARGTMGYEGIAEQDVYDVLADVERRYPVDEDRVYLTGISMGGGGALRLAMTRPDVWAAVAPLCPDALPGSEEFAPNLLNVPVRLFQGEVDPIVPAASTRAWQKRFLDLGIPASYFEYPMVRHNVWDIAYRPGAALDWFAGLRRNSFPERVRFVTESYRYSTAYWLRIDGLTPGLQASIDARRVGKPEVQVITKNIDGFTILPQGWPVSELPRQVTIDGTTVIIRAANLSFTKTAEGWRAGLLQPAGKRPGAEGPIAAAVSSRHIYVYGTLGIRTAEELDARRKVAEAAAAWSTTRSRLALKLPVKADSEVTAEDMDSADLVLFGTAESNAVIARNAGSLPLALRPDAADYGLLFIAPLGKHYALVSSGLPWWPGSDEPAAAGYSLAPAQYRLLSTFGDYVLFRGSTAHVVAEGRFDGNWKLPAEAAAKMSATGTVTIH